MEKKDLLQYYIDLAPKKFYTGSLSQIEDEGIKRFVELTLAIKNQEVEIMILKGIDEEAANRHVFPELYLEEIKDE